MSEAVCQLYQIPVVLFRVLLLFVDTLLDRFYAFFELFEHPLGSVNSVLPSEERNLLLSIQFQSGNRTVGARFLAKREVFGYPLWKERIQSVLRVPVLVSVFIKIFGQLADLAAVHRPVVDSPELENRERASGKRRDPNECVT